MKTPPAPPRPDAIRTPPSGFGWLDARLLREHWMEGLGPDAIAVLTFLALAADRRGVSFYGRDRMAVALDLDLTRLDQALDKLLEAGLVAHRPWRKTRRDGVWQVLPLPPRAGTRRSSHSDQPRPAGDLLRDLGVAPRARNRGS